MLEEREQKARGKSAKTIRGMMEMNHESPVCIIGMHRSGTSMVARLLQGAGMYLGADDRLLSADTANPDGHFEHTGFLEINNALLQRLGGSWDAPPRMKAGWELDASLEELRVKAKLLISAFEGKLRWGWKEPRTTILLPFWKSLISNLQFVLCVRSPLDVAKSLEKRNQMAIDHGAYLWSRYMRAAIQDTEGCPRHLAFYDDFFGDYDAEPRQLVNFCKLGSESHKAIVDSVVRSELRHHTTGISELLKEPLVPEHAKILYIGLRALSVRGFDSITNGADANEDISRFLKLVDEFYEQGQLGSLRTTLFEMAAELSTLRHTTWKELENKNHEIRALQDQRYELEQHADRLQKFADAVRQTYAYRIYRSFLRPLKRG